MITIIIVFIINSYISGDEDENRTRHSGILCL